MTYCNQCGQNWDNETMYKEHMCNHKFNTSSFVKIPAVRTGKDLRIETLEEQNKILNDAVFALDKRNDNLEEELDIVTCNLEGETNQHRKLYKQMGDQMQNLRSLLKEAEQMHVPGNRHDWRKRVKEALGE